MEEEKAIKKDVEISKIGGYLVAAGALVGFSVGLYFLVDRELFSFLIRISSFEAMNYFLGVFIPSFIMLIVIGYLFITTLGLQKAELSNIAPLCALSLLCMVLSMLSVFYFISFLGGLLTLTTTIKVYTRPTFKTLHKREAFFLMEIGAMLIATFSMLFLSMWFVSYLYPTYAMGHYGGYSPFALLMVGVLSILMFFAIPMIGSEGTGAGLCGVFGTIMIILTYLFVIQNQYGFFNVPAYAGVFILLLGFASALSGDLLYVRLFLYEPMEPTSVLTTSLLSHGIYCPHCGSPRVTSSQDSCSTCGRNLLWTPYAPYCPSCGRLVPSDADACPHCREDIGNKRIYYHLKTAEEHVISDKLAKESKKKPSRILKWLLKTTRILRTVGRAVWRVYNFFQSVIDRLPLSLKDFVLIVILTYLLGFIAFIGYKRVGPTSTLSESNVGFNYGFPLEWLQVSAEVLARRTNVYDVNVLWGPLILDILLYFLASLALVYGVAKLRR